MSQRGFDDPAMVVDASGLECPLPILKAKKALSGLAAGQVLEIVTTDRKARQDFQAFCKQTGNPLLAQEEVAEKVHHFLQRRA